MLITERFCSNCGAENPNFQFDYEEKEDERLSDKKQQNAEKFLSFALFCLMDLRLLCQYHSSLYL